MKFAPDNLEKCSDHPNALIGKVTDSKQYIMNGYPAGNPLVTFKYYCHECNKELRASHDRHRTPGIA